MKRWLVPRAGRPPLLLLSYLHQSAIGELARRSQAKRERARQLHASGEEFHYVLSFAGNLKLPQAGHCSGSGAK
jgi:hypothetical protein